MLEWANRLVTVAYLVERNEFGYPELNPDGTPVLDLDADGRPQLDPEHPGAAAALQRWVDNIDIFRQLTSTFERSMSDADLPQP
jgi:hypothetical protein